MKNNRKIKSIFLEGWRPYFWICLIGFAIFFQTLFYQFTYFDDNTLILDNFKFLSDFSNLFIAFKQQVFHVLHHSAAYYRPILTISFMIDAHLGGQKPFFYHLTDILLHLASGMLIFIILQKLKYSKGVSFIFSLFFIVHPLQSQAVAWIPGRNDPLAAVFTLAALNSLIDFSKSSDSKASSDDLEGREKYYFYHLIFFALALFSKETSLMLIPLGLVYLLLIAKDKLFSFRQQLLLVGWLVVIVGWYLLRRIALSENPVEMTPVDMIWSTIKNLPAVIQFIGKLFFPFNMSVLPIIQDTTFIYGAIASFVLIVGLFFSKSRRWPYVIFGTLWFFGFLIPSFMRPNPNIVADFLEHRAYIPFLGVIIVVLETDLVGYLKKKKIVAAAIPIFVLLGFSVLTIQHNQDYKNKIAFWQNAVKTSPHHPLAWRNLGAMYYLDGRKDEAIPLYQKALELNPTEEMAHNNLGLIYAEKGEDAKAEEEYKQELKNYPTYDNANFNIGLLYYKTGRIKEAEESWGRTITINPDYYAAYQNLAISFAGHGDYSRAAMVVRDMQARDFHVPPALMQIINNQSSTGLKLQ